MDCIICNCNNLCFTIGSVSKLERVKMFASMLVKETPEEDFLGFVVFGTQAKLIHPLCRMMAYNKVIVRNQISFLYIVL